jgi:hypothetical protein
VDDEPEDEDNLDWFDTSLDMEIDQEELASQGGDLLGLSGSLLLGEEESEELEEEVEEDESLSLRDFDFDTTSTASDVKLQGQDLSALRFDAIISEEEEGEDDAQVDALKDLTGGLTTGAAFSDVDYTVDDYTDQPVITDRQAERIAKLENLLTAQAVDSSRYTQTDESPVLRLVLAAVLLAALILPTVTNFRVVQTPQPAAGVRTADQIIERLDDNATVVMAFEYEATAAGELEPAAVALLEHISDTSEDIQVIAASTRPLGPVMIDRAFGEASPQDAWFNVGYVPGQAVGVRGFTIGATGGVVSPLRSTVDGERTELEATGLLQLEPDLLIIIAAQTDEVRYWLEQAAPSLESDVLLVSGAGAAPLASAYANTQEVDAILRGTPDIAAYMGLQRADTTNVETVLNAQVFGAAVAAAMIILIGGLLIIIERQGGRVSS